MRSVPRTLIEHLQGAGILALLLALFFSTPLARYREVQFTCADMLQDFSLLRVEPDHRSGNKVPGDTATQMQPWTMFNRSELAAGRVPLWNPWNGAGAPHLANYQSAVFSPFSAPFYLLDRKPALLLSAFAKLFALGFFTWLFLRELGLARIAALLGAAAFTFSGHCVFWLGYPHVGVMVALPGGLYFAEKALRRCEVFATMTAGTPGTAETRGAREGADADDEPEAGPAIGGPLAGLTLSLTAGLLAGHPEPILFAVAIVAAWIAFRGIGIAAAVRKRGGSLRPFVRPAAAFGISGVLAAGLAAFQLLPFLEYLRHSTVFVRRSGHLTPLDAAHWPLAFFPAALGDPSTRAGLDLGLPEPNFAEVNVVYVGGTILFLPLLGLGFARRDRRLRFFLGACAIWIVYAYDLLGTARWIERIPWIGLAPMGRSQGSWAFLVACAAALSLDHLLRRETKPAWGRAVATALAGLAFLAVFRLGVQTLVDRYADRPSPTRGAYEAFLPGHLRSMAEIFAGAVVAICLLWVARAPRLRTFAGAMVVVVAFLGTGWTFKDYNPVSEDRFVYPRTPAVEELRRTVGSGRVAILGEDGIPPDANLAYEIALVQNNDAMWVRDFDAYYRDRFGSTYAWRPTVRASETALRTCGVEWVLAKWDWLGVDAGASWEGELRDVRFEPVAVAPEPGLSQRFVCETDRLQSVMVLAGVLPAARAGSLRIRLVETASGRVVAERTATSREIEADVYTAGHVPGRYDPRGPPAGRPLVLDFEPQAGSAGREYTLALAAEAGAADPVTVWTVKGSLACAWSSAREGFDLVASIGDYGLYRSRNSLGKYWTVRHAAIAADEADAVELMRASTFDPGRVVVLGPEDFDGDPDGRSDRRIVRAGDPPRPHLVGRDGKTMLAIGDEARFLAEQLGRWDVETLPEAEVRQLELVTRETELERRTGTPVADLPPMRTGPLRMVEETPEDVRIEVETAEPGYLVLAQTRYPGWEARVNGLERPVLRANFAFSAVELQTGLNIVDFHYEPGSFRAGLWIALASLCALLLGLLPRSC